MQDHPRWAWTNRARLSEGGSRPRGRHAGGCGRPGPGLERSLPRGCPGSVGLLRPRRQRDLGRASGRGCGNRLYQLVARRHRQVVEQALARRLDVVSTCEPLARPAADDPDAQVLDEAARAAGRRVLGVGVDPVS